MHGCVNLKTHTKGVEGRHFNIHTGVNKPMALIKRGARYVESIFLLEGSNRHSHILTFTHSRYSGYDIYLQTIDMEY
jgi:hypothetical protein